MHIYINFALLLNLNFLWNFVDGENLISTEFHLKNLTIYINSSKEEHPF